MVSDTLEPTTRMAKGESSSTTAAQARAGWGFMARLAIKVATTLHPSWKPLTYVNTKTSATRIQKDGAIAVLHIPSQGYIVILYANVFERKGKKNQGLLPWDVHIMDEWNEKVKYKMSRLTFCIILDGKIKRIPQ